MLGDDNDGEWYSAPIDDTEEVIEPVVVVDPIPEEPVAIDPVVVEQDTTVETTGKWWAKTKQATADAASKTADVAAAATSKAVDASTGAWDQVNGGNLSLMAEPAEVPKSGSYGWTLTVGASLVAVAAGIHMRKNKKNDSDDFTMV